MIGSAQHFLAKWLTSILDHILLLYSTICIRDSFTFAQAIRQFDLALSAFLCSFNISSLFTNVPLAEVINICANALYDSGLIAPFFPREVLLMYSCKQQLNLLNSVWTISCTDKLMVYPWASHRVQRWPTFLSVIKKPYCLEE